MIGHKPAAITMAESKARREEVRVPAGIGVKPCLPVDAKAEAIHVGYVDDEQPEFRSSRHVFLLGWLGLDHFELDVLGVSDVLVEMLAPSSVAVEFARAGVAARDRSVR